MSSEKSQAIVCINFIKRDALENALRQLYMLSLNKAIIVAANPFRECTVAPGKETKLLGDVEYHREHLDKHGGVF
ncbi:MAG: hypothetical protein QXV01_11440 [Candidatus Bathyarchaeia archaeon]